MGYRIKIGKKDFGISLDREIDAIKIAKKLRTQIKVVKG